MMKETWGNSDCFMRSSKWVDACPHPRGWAGSAGVGVAKGKVKVGVFAGGTLDEVRLCMSEPVARSCLRA